MNILKRSAYGLALTLLLFVLFQAQTSRAVIVAGIGQNFTGSTYGVDSFFVPPDANGAAGPLYFVEIINGRFAVYDKLTGTRIKSLTDDSFWSQAGVSLPGGWGEADPRVIYDPATQRWFASAIGFDPTGLINTNYFLLAVSADADPTGTWKAVAVLADSRDFADFPTLGLDDNGVYVAGDMFPPFGNPTGMTLLSFPKADLLAATPTAANMTRFTSLSYSTYGEILQPVVCLDGSSAGRILAAESAGVDFQTHTSLKTFTVANAAGPGSATHSSVTSITIPGYDVPINPYQPDGSDNLDDGDARLSAMVRCVNGVFYAVHGVQYNNRAAVRWYRINAADNSLLESGTITTNLDLFYPSIAANDDGTVVIGFNGCSSNSFISAYAVVGRTVGGVTTFGPLMLLKAGNVSYQNTDSTGYSRWGDYSTTSVDPADPTRFWTIQMYPSAGDSWSTQITEILTGPVPLTIGATGTNAAISWPTYAAALHLETATNLAITATWTQLTPTLITNGNLVTAMVPVPNTHQYFRLNATP